MANAGDKDEQYDSLPSLAMTTDENYPVSQEAFHCPASLRGVTASATAEFNISLPIRELYPISRLTSFPSGLKTKV